MTVHSILRAMARSTTALPAVVLLAPSILVPAVLAPVALAPAAAVAQETTDAVAFAIPAGSLSGALATFGEAADMQVVYPAELARGLSSPGVSGRMTPQDALDRLLAGSGLTWRFTGPATVTLIALTGGPDASGAVVLDPVTVQGSRPSALESARATGPVQGYRADRSLSVAKTDTPIIETPQSISVVGREQMEDQGSQTVMQAMRYTPGAFTGQVGASNRYDYVILRGFVDRSIDNVYLDGLKMMSDDSTYSSMQVDPYFLERIEAVRGPASVLYGRSSPGGLIALTSKKPLFEPRREVEIKAGSRNQAGVGFDFSDAVGGSGRMAYRLTGLADRQDSQADHAKEERYAIAPSFTALLGEDTTLTLQGMFQRDPEGGTHNGVPAEGSLFARNGGFISRHFFDGEPGRETYERHQDMVGYQIDHRVDDTWTLRQNARYLDSSVDIDQIYQVGWVGGTNTLARFYGGGSESLHAVAVDTQAQADFTTGAAAHTVVTGLDYHQCQSRNDWMFGAVPGLNAFSPVYGGTAVTAPTFMKNTRSLEQTGVYIQDQVALDGWRLTLGGRQDWVETSNHNRLAGTTASEERQKFTGRAGLLYLFDNGVAPYVSYSESFSPSLYVDAAGQPLEPSEGTQYEAGVKYQPPGSDSMVSAAVFHITQENVAVQDPLTFTFSPAGTIRSKGLELEGNLQLTDEFRLLAGYALTDAVYESSPNTGKEGNTPPQVPRHSASLWGEYAFLGGPLKALSLGAGARWVGESWADSNNTTKVPGYAVFDASLRYDLEQMGFTGAEMRLNATNLFDKTYVASCLELANCYYGEERTVTATLRYRF